MPCPDCGHLLCIDRKDQRTLICPRCSGVKLENRHQIEWRLKWLLEDHFTSANLINVFGDFTQVEAITTLLDRIDQNTRDFRENAKMHSSDYGYISYLLKQIYQNIDRGEGHSFRTSELDEVATELIDGYSVVIGTLNHIQDEFVLLEKAREDVSVDPLDIVDERNYRRWATEYWLCFDRCTKSLIGGAEENYKIFSFVSDHLRHVDRPNPDEIDDLYDYGDCWYELITSLALISSFDDLISDAYTTFLPSYVSIFDIQDFLNALNTQTENSPELFDIAEVDEYGLSIFGKEWKEVKDFLIMSDDNVDAHPLLFEINFIQKFVVPGSRRPRKRTVTKIVYPKHLASLLKFQLYPLLQNGDQPSGHNLLAKLTKRRGEAFEKQLYEYLNERMSDCYYSVEISKTEQREIDILFTHDDCLVFIESKFVTPPLHLNSINGIQELDNKFNHKIFKEETSYNGEPEGRPFQEKVSDWVDLEPGQSFTAKDASDNRSTHEIKEEWQDMTVKRFVVSNLVPSFIKKNGVRFLTDLELYKHIEYDEDIFYRLPLSSD